jgi:hypothetical protein
MSLTLNNLKRFEYTDILGWSVSRYDKFKSCARQYYYDYYAKYDLEFPREKINKLKAMTSIALEAGNVVHDSVKVLLERLLKSDKPIDNGRFIEYTRNMAEQYCKAKTFSEVYYGAMQSAGVGDIFPAVELSLNNLLASERFKWIREKALANKDGWVIEPPGYGETRIAGMKAYCKVDFLFPVDGSLFILDWKTGKKDETKHAKQLLGYATWASFHFDVDPANIKPSIVYLQPVYSELEKSFSSASTRDFINQVKAETEELYCMCRDIPKNLPKEKADFKRTENKFVCKYCNYKELCDRKTYSTPSIPL